MFRTKTYYNNQLKKIKDEPEFYRNKTQTFVRSTDFILNHKYEKELNDVKNDIKNNTGLSNQKKKKLLRTLHNEEYYDRENIKEVGEDFENMFSSKKRVSRRKAPKRRVLRRKVSKRRAPKH